MGLINSGFQLETVEEAVVSEEMKNLSQMENEMQRPMMLLVKANKAVKG